jgi:hypothetical protein
MIHQQDMATDASEQPSIFEDPYQREILMDNWQTEKKGTLQSILIIIGVILVSDLLALFKNNQLNTENLIVVLFIPAIFTGLYFYARSQPYAAMLAIIVIFSLVALLAIIESGGTYLVSGFIAKGLLVYAMIKGYRHAKEAKEGKTALDQLV